MNTPIPPVLTGPESGRVIAEIVSSQKLADDIRAACEADPLEVACDLLRLTLGDPCRVEATCDCHDCRLDRRIRAFLADHGR